MGSVKIWTIQGHYADKTASKLTTHLKCFNSTRNLKSIEMNVIGLLPRRSSRISPECACMLSVCVRACVCVFGFVWFSSVYRLGLSDSHFQAQQTSGPLPPPSHQFVPSPPGDNSPVRPSAPGQVKTCFPESSVVGDKKSCVAGFGPWGQICVILLLQSGLGTETSTHHTWCKWREQTKLRNSI